eukprot:Seg73.3 transcript_id=Seg73.3/GoldUCD/mRNA.D3Y31 product="hypothetical protein" protein_id=Seg73.3/GoldUCD/D3Y31
MEKLLDAPRLFEDTKRRYILALEAQKKSQILVISNAQRKLVHSFQQKLKTSATITKRHQAWKNETDIARHGFQRKGKQKNYNANIDGLLTNRNIERPWLKNEVWKSKRRPKTTGATTNQLSGHFEKELTENLLPRPKDRGNEFVLRDFEQGADEVRGEIKVMISNSEGSFAGRRSRRSNNKDARKESAKLDRELLISDVDGENMVCKWKVDSYKDVPNSNGMLTMGKDHCRNHVSVRARNQTVTSEEQFNYFGTGHLERCKVVAPYVVTNDGREMIDNSEGESEVNPHARSITGERKMMESYKFDRRRRKNSAKTETDSSFLKSCDGEGYAGCWKRPSDGTRLSGSKTNNTSTSLSLKQELTGMNRSKTAPTVHSTSQIETKAHYKHRGRALSNNDSNDTSQVSDEFRKNKISYEMRTWIYDIKRDVKRAQYPEADDNHDSKIFQEAAGSQSSLTNEKSTNSSEALEKFEAIFNTIYINDQNGGDAHIAGPVEKLDTAALYSKSAVADSRKRAKQTWNLRDPRNQKLQPNIIL